MTTTTLSKREQVKQEQESAKEYLRSIFDAQGRPVAYTSLKWVSPNGMSRDMKVLVVVNNQILDITWYIAKLDIGTLKERTGQRVIRVGGCGMDMGFHVVYTLSAVLYGYQERGAYKINQEWI